MTALPPHRRIIHGRTHGHSWSPSSMDPIRHYKRGGGWTSVLLAIAIGIAAAVCIVKWIDWSLT